MRFILLSLWCKDRGQEGSCPSVLYAILLTLSRLAKLSKAGYNPLR
jgi:hypothetical protein